MGRKPLASKAVRAPSAEGGNIPLIEGGLGTGATKLLSELPEKLPDNINVASNGMELANGSVKSTEVTTVPQPKRKGRPTIDSSKAKLKKPKAAVRRSGRLGSVIMPVTSKDKAPVIEDLAAQDGEEGHVPSASKKTQVPEQSLSEKNLEDKVVSLSQELGQLKTSFEALISKFEKMEQVCSGRTPGANTSTDSTHDECQKKIAALTKENANLTKKLENAHMLYSKGNCIFGELLEKMKDVMLLFGLQVKAAEMVLPASDGTDSTGERGLVGGMN